MFKTVFEGQTISGTVPPESQLVVNDEEYMGANFQLQPITENELTLVVNTIVSKIKERLYA